MLKSVKFIALDMDGVLKVGNRPIVGADQTVNKLQQKGYELMIVTNECRWTPDQISEQLADMGLPICAKLPIYTAGMAARDYMLRHGLTVANRNIIGGDGLRDVLKSVRSSTGDSKTVVVIGTQDGNVSGSCSEQVDTVILTCSDLLDPSSTTLKMPLQVLAQAGIVATNVISVGKPHETVINAILNCFGVADPQSVLFVGDTLYTDILLARQAGFQSALVLTGNTQVTDRIPEEQRPDIILNTLEELNGLV